MSLGSDLAAAISQIVTNAAILRAVVQGPASGTNSIVTLPDGSQVKTLARVAAEVVAYLATFPAGGTTGQVLAKTSNTDYAVAWSTLPNQSTTAPTFHALTSGSGTWNLPGGAKWMRVIAVGGGGGGGGANNTSPGSTGGSTTFGALTAPGGAGSTHIAAGAPGVGSGGNVRNQAGTRGDPGSWNEVSASASAAGGTGGSTEFGPGGTCAYASGGGAANANSGAGGAGGGTNAVGWALGGYGGSSGGIVEHIYSAPAASYSYAVGAGGAGAAGGDGYSAAGGAGGSGAIFIWVHYNW